MSLTRTIARLPLRGCLSATNHFCRRTVSNQSTFEGVFSPYFWDHETGFGCSQNGDLVLVSSTENRKDDAIVSESAFWKQLLEPSLGIDHDLLKDELQMNVLAYDNDAVHLHERSVQTMALPIYKGSLSNQDSLSPSTNPFSTGGTSSGPENRSGDPNHSPHQACA